jgi:exodeoxyribonuclease V alpha subunit
MTVTGLPETDPLSPAIAHRASGLLAQFNLAGVLASSDVHVASRLARLAGVEDEAVVLATALAVRAPRLGHVCVDLASIRDTASSDLDTLVEVRSLPWPATDEWLAGLATSALVGGARPLRLEGTTIYLDRYWAFEIQVAADLLARASSDPAPIDESDLAARITDLFGPQPAGGDAPDLQRVAAAAAVMRRLAVVAGGPGTGKTTIIGRVLALLDMQEEAGGRRPPVIGLAAPTGKAAVTLEEAVHRQARELPLPSATRERLLSLSGLTLHRLLG